MYQECLEKEGGNIFPFSFYVKYQVYTSGLVYLLRAVCSAAVVPSISGDGNVFL